MARPAERDSGTEPLVRAVIGGSVRIGGAGLGGVTISLSGAVSRSTITLTAGTYSFADLAAGSYTVTVHLPAGHQLLPGEAGSRPVTVAEGKQAVIDFELARATAAAGVLAGSVRVGEAGIAGVSLRLAGAGATRGGVALSTATSALGGYSFPDLGEGAYLVTLIPPSGFELAANEAIARNVVVQGGQTTLVDFQLAPIAGGTLRVVNLVGFDFLPAELTVGPGTTVRWSNGSSIGHTVTPDGHQEWSEAELGAGQDFEHTFWATGVYPTIATRTGNGDDGCHPGRVNCRAGRRGAGTWGARSGAVLLLPWRRALPWKSHHSLRAWSSMSTLSSSP